MQVRGRRRHCTTCKASERHSCMVSQLYALLWVGRRHCGNELFEGGKLLQRWHSVVAFAQMRHSQLQEQHTEQAVHQHRQHAATVPLL